MAITIEGLDKISKHLKKNVTLDDVRKVVRVNGAELHSKVMNNADFKKGYQTGTTKRSIMLDFKDGGLTAEVEPETEYSPYLEYGTRFMEAQPFVRPALEVQGEQFVKDLKKLLR